MDGLAPTVLRTISSLSTIIDTNSSDRLTSSVAESGYSVSTQQLKIAAMNVRTKQNLMVLFFYQLKSVLIHCSSKYKLQQWRREGEAAALCLFLYQFTFDHLPSAITIAIIISRISRCRLHDLRVIQAEGRKLCISEPKCFRNMRATDFEILQSNG